MKPLFVAVMVLMAAAAHADELITAKSPVPVAETLDRVEAAARAEGFAIVARVDHAANAARIGQTLRPTALLVFGKAQGGTPLMLCDQRAGIDLPLKALAWQDEAGQVWVGMTDPAVLKARYALGPACDAPLAGMRRAIGGFLEAAAK